MSATPDSARLRRALRAKAVELILFAGLLALVVTFTAVHGITAGTACAVGAMAGLMAMLILEARDQERAEPPRESIVRKPSERRRQYARPGAVAEAFGDDEPMFPLPKMDYPSGSFRKGDDER